MDEHAKTSLSDSDARRQYDEVSKSTMVTASQQMRPHLAGKAKPVSISFAEEHLIAIDGLIRQERITGYRGVTRSDIVRAAVIALERLPVREVSELVKKVKLK